MKPGIPTERSNSGNLSTHAVSGSTNTGTPAVNNLQTVNTVSPVERSHTVNSPRGDQASQQVKESAGVDEVDV